MQYRTIAFLMSAMILAGCDKECVTTLKISARSEGQATRTALREDRSVAFTDGDCIAVFDGADKRKFTSSTIYDDGSADFMGSIISPTDSYIAVYPYQAQCTPYGDGLFLMIPETQNAVAGSFDPAANISVGRTENIADDTHTLSLQNVCSLVKFSVPEGMTYSTAILFTGTPEVCLTGGVHCTVDDNPSTNPDFDTYNGYAILQGTITGGNWYYIAVNPATLPEGFALYLFDGEGRVEELADYSTYKGTEKSVTLKRSGILNLGIIGAEPGAAFEPLDGETIFEW